MADEVVTTTSEQATEVAESVNEELVNDAEFTDSTETSEAEEQAKAERVEKAKQTRAQNAEYARQRREAETAQRISSAEKTAREQGIIDALNGKNPYTGQAMTDSADVEEFLMMREIENNGGDPLSSSEYNRHLKKKAEEQRALTEKAQAQRNWYSSDKADFVSKHPDVNINSLIADKNFQAYADGKVGTRPLSDIYEGYLRITGGAKAEGANSVKQSMANAKASPGSLATSQPIQGDFLTREQVQARAKDKNWIRQNYSLIEKSMAKW